MRLYLLWYIPLVILQMWMLQNINCESRHPTIEYQFDKHPNSDIRPKKETSGFLEANSIHAERMNTNKLFSKDVTADIVKANKVKSVIISLGRSFSFKKGRRKGSNRDTFILNRDGVDSTETSVTIFLKRDNNESVSINGYDSGKTKQKHYSSRQIPRVRNLMDKSEYFSNPVSIQNELYKTNTNTNTKPKLGFPLQHTYLPKYQSSNLKRKARHVQPTSRPFGSFYDQNEKASTLQTNNNMRSNWRKKNFMFANHQESQNSAVQGIAENIHGNRIHVSPFMHQSFQNKGILQHQLFKLESTPLSTHRFLQTGKQTDEFDESDVSFSSDTDDILNSVTPHNEFPIQETARIVKKKDTHISTGKSFPLLDTNWYTDYNEMHTSDRNVVIPVSGTTIMNHNEHYPTSVNDNTADDTNVWNRKNTFVRKRVSSQTETNNHAKFYLRRLMVDTLKQTAIIHEINRIKRLQQKGYKYKTKQRVVQQSSSQEYESSFIDSDSDDWHSEDDYKESRVPAKMFGQAKRRIIYDSIYGKFSTSEENVRHQEAKNSFKQPTVLTRNNVNDRRNLYIANSHSFIRKKGNFFFS
ncbi:uncharacterized protein [Mytilus edulis]|uniref:uncharacterized protein n=1 Tax=Mytilus edulis TaxID=6550 RepID=UPI0039EF5860